MNLDKKIYILRMILGIVGGFSAGFFKFTMEYMGLVILIASIIYLATIFLSYKWAVRNREYNVKLIFLEGIGAYIFLWLFMWALVFNILFIYVPS